MTDISLSAGNTGALLVISRLILNTIDGINKPALAGFWPNKNSISIVLDLGANIECDEKNLFEPFTWKYFDEYVHIRQSGHLKRTLVFLATFHRRCSGQLNP